jgi:thymidylate synthase (FAD)
MAIIQIIKEPTVIIVADMALREGACTELISWLEQVDPACLEGSEDNAPFDRLIPHGGWRRGTDEPESLTDNECLVELAGRGCYRSFGAKAGRRQNDEYVANLFGEPGKIPHASVLYHAKMTFFFAGLSRRASHELIRHYVGADRSEEGCPSQESTRYTEHPGHFALHPRDEGNIEELFAYRQEMERAYAAYREYLEREGVRYEKRHGHAPKGMDRKRIYEAAAMRLPASACTSFFWTTNPEALDKLFRERCDFAADLEIQRFATKLRATCHAAWPNLFRASNPVYQKSIHSASTLPRTDAEVRLNEE